MLLCGCARTAEVTPPRPTGTAATACRALADRLPARVSDEERRETDPASRYTAAWGDPPITVRCGVRKPAQLTPTAMLFTVDDVDWLPLPQDSDAPTRFYAVERRAYVEVVVPAEHAPASDALVDLGKAIAASIPKKKP